MTADEHIEPAIAIETWEVVDLLGSLLDKSLVSRDDDGRFHMLETVREFGRTHLTQTSEFAKLRDRHLGAFLDLAKEACDNIEGAGQVAWLNCLDIEHDNLRAAMEWGLEHRHANLAGARIPGTIWWPWMARGRISEGREWISRALATDPPDPAVRASLLHGAGALSAMQGDGRAALPMHEEALELFRQVYAQRNVTASLNSLGILAQERGAYEEARTLHEEALRMRRSLGDRVGTASSLNNLGNTLRQLGDYETARTLFEECLSIQREITNRHGCAMALCNLANVINDLGERPLAKSLQEEGLTIRRDLKDRHGIAMSLGKLAIVVDDMGDHLTARAQFTESLTIAKELSMRSSIAFALEGLAVIDSGTDMVLSARLWGAAERLREVIEVPILPSDLPRRARAMAAARATLGDESFAAAWDEGRAMAMEQAVGLAIEEPNG